MTIPSIQSTQSDLAARVRDALAPVVALRHELHQRPELSYQETNTARRIVGELEALGIEHRPGMAGGTGTLAHLPATRPGARGSVALRADIDALPIHERTGKPYASQSPGVMHACGHDGHTAILLGVARVLSQLEDRPNPVTLIFQPAEEGGGGGERMCDEGCLRGEGAGGLGPPVRRIFGLHGWPELPLGVVSTRPGPLLAATDDFVVNIRGEQAHAAYPHLGHDPVLAAAHVITALQSIASRSVDPLDSVVVTVAAIHGGTANNIIPDTVQFLGTIRTLTPAARALANERFKSVAEHAAASLGCHAEVHLEPGYPVTSNDPALVEEFFAAARTALGEDRVRLAPAPGMGGEDFSYYGQHVPACFFLLGLKPEGADSYPQLHQPDFDFNDDAIPTGIEMMCRLALKPLD
ncbi:MAG: M20 family metallopeptidase [Phycisphaerales bacterium JB037]